MIRVVRRVRVALVVVLAGLVVQLLAALFWSPLAFVLFAVFGVFPVIVGAAFFLWSVYRAIDPEDAPPAGVLEEET